MKTLRYIIAFAAAATFMGSCKPIEKRYTLENSFTPSELKLQVVQSVPGGNKLSIQMNTPAVTGWWDYIIDKKMTNQVDVVFPFTGTHTFTFTSSTPYLEPNGKSVFVSKTVQVEITKLTDSLPKPYYALVGDNLEGKTWVFDGVLGDGRIWFAMANGSNWEEIWWNAGGENQIDLPDALGEMKFDLAGGANFTYKETPTSPPVTGSSFKFNSSYSTLTVVGGAQCLGAKRVGAGIDLEIKKLTKDQLILFTPNASAYGTGWVFYYKPKP